MKLAYAGTGYVGLVNGTVSAEMGNLVVCSDIDKTRIEKLKRLEMPLYEKNLEELVRKNVAAGRLNFTSNLDEAVDFADIIFTCVGTPPKDDGSADLSAIFDVAEQVGQRVKAKNLGYRLLVNKSTIPPGTTAAVYDHLANILYAGTFDVAMNPEFLKQGSAVDDTLRPDRVVIGVNSQRAEQMLSQLYAPFVRSGSPIRVMSPVEAELVKYVSNTALAVRLSFFYECSNLADVVGANIRKVLEAVTDDSRIGKQFAHPSGGYGGSCFPKDSKALVHTGDFFGVDLSVARAGDASNELQKRILLKKIDVYFPQGVGGLTFAMWGLAFKAGTDDTREAPAVVLADDLLKRGAKIRAYDPQAMNNARAKTCLKDRIYYAKDANDALCGSDALVVCTEWPEFSTPDFDGIKSSIRSPVIFDNKSLYNPVVMTQKGFVYFGVGVENDLARDYRKKAGK